MPDLVRGDNIGDEFGPAGDLLDLLARGRPGWMRDALCQEYPTVNFFPSDNGRALAAKRVCQKCLVEPECRAWSFAQDPSLDGVWGGLTQRERNRLRREKQAEKVA